MNDKDWLELIASSPKKARGRLFEEYKALVCAIVLSKLKGSASIEEIEDCVNDVFAEVYSSLPGFTAKGTMKAFVSTIAVRVSINAFKRGMYRKKLTSSIEEESVELPPSKSDTSSSVEDMEFRKRLWEIVDSLGKPDAQIIVYQYCYELKVKEIAKKLSMSPEAVQKRSLRARERIRRQLENEDLI